MESDSKFRVLLPIEPDEPVKDLCSLLQAFFRPESTLLRPFYAARPLQAEVFLPEASAALPELCRIDLESRLAAEDQLRRTAAPFGAAGFATEPDVVSGPPIPSILEEISAWHADLTVVRTSRVVQPEGRIGHLTSALSRSAATPILTYRDAPEGFRPRRLLIATDFSESSKAAADWGMAFAELTGAEAHLLYVIARHGTRKLDSDILVREGSAEIGRWRSRIDPAFPHPVTDAHVISAEYPSEGILNFATDSGFDMIVLAGTGRTVLGGMLLGSNARAVIRWSDRPVLLVPNSNRVPAASMLSKLQATVASR
ncbi:MAG: universal stress protein [Thermoanaerobaculia bacterium]